MSDIITEALLEMHFHSEIVERLKRRFGANFFRILKPSTRDEAWVGFDQGWVHTTLSNNQLLSELKNKISNRENTIHNFYVGFFLQFKKVKILSRRSKYIPPRYKLPYYRTELSLSPNKTTGISQHETLMLLKDINNAIVYYACAMLFDINDIYEPVNLDYLRLVPLSSAPNGWVTTEKHFITFQNPTDPNPFWCSDPKEGISYSFDDWIYGQIDNSLKILKASELLELIYDIVKKVSGKPFEGKELFEFNIETFANIFQFIPESFTIIELNKKYIEDDLSV